MLPTPQNTTTFSSTTNKTSRERGYSSPRAHCTPAPRHAQCNNFQSFQGVTDFHNSHNSHTDKATTYSHRAIPPNRKKTTCHKTGSKSPYETKYNKIHIPYSDLVSTINKLRLKSCEGKTISSTIFKLWSYPDVFAKEVPMLVEKLSQSSVTLDDEDIKNAFLSLPSLDGANQNTKELVQALADKISASSSKLSNDTIGQVCYSLKYLCGEHSFTSTGDS